MQDILIPTRNRKWKSIATRVRAKSQAQTVTILFYTQTLISGTADKPETILAGEPHGKFKYTGKVYPNFKTG